MRVRNWVRVVGSAGRGAAAMVVVGVRWPQPPKAEPVKPASGKPTRRSRPTRSATMLAEARAAYAKTRDYCGTFTRQERINGTLCGRAGRRDEDARQSGRRVRPLRPARDAARDGGRVLRGEEGRQGRLPPRRRRRPQGVPEAGRRTTRSSWPTTATRSPNGAWGRSSSWSPRRRPARRR